MILTRRQQAICDLIDEQGRIYVADLAERLKATPQTIRKDLEALASAQKLVRFHGGAEKPEQAEYTGYDKRRFIAAREKAEIGAEVARLVPDGAVLFINAGTTTEAVAHALHRHSGLSVITDNILIANILRGFSGVETMIAGGRVRASDGAVVGTAATGFVRQFRVDYAIIGAAAIDQDGVLLDFDYDEAQVARAMIENARHVVLAADRSKWRLQAPTKIGSLADIHTFVTDRLETGAQRRLCQEAGVELRETFSASAAAE